MLHPKSKSLKFIPGQGFNALVKKIKADKLKFFQDVKKLTARYYWDLGDNIHRHILENKDRADYGKFVYPELEKTTEIDQTTLYRAVKFRVSYPILGRGQELNWLIYRKLITVADKQERAALENLVIKKGWSGEDLQEHLNTRHMIEKIKDHDAPIPKLKFERGTLYTYQMVKETTLLEFPDRLYVDHGFYNRKWINLSASSKYKEGDIVETFKDDEGRYSLKASARQPKDLYTFKAVVKRLVDADTCWIVVDTGFDNWRIQELRLRGIDCPEMSTPEGQAAKRFVEKRLRICEFIVIKTYKDDKYKRMLVDVFYKEGEKDPAKVAAQGIFLNQELLNNRLAILWKL